MLLLATLGTRTGRKQPAAPAQRTLIEDGLFQRIGCRRFDHLAVAGLWSAILGSLVVSLVTMLLGGALKDGKRER